MTDKECVLCYHLTKAENLKSIREQGLIPEIGKHSGACNEEVPRVYLFPKSEDVQYALENWNWFEEEDEILLLKLRVPKEMLAEGETDFELYAYLTIPSSCIEAVYDEYEMTDIFDGKLIGTTKELFMAKQDVSDESIQKERVVPMKSIEESLENFLKYNGIEVQTAGTDGFVAIDVFDIEHDVETFEDVVVLASKIENILADLEEEAKESGIENSPATEKEWAHYADVNDNAFTKAHAFELDIMKLVAYPDIATLEEAVRASGNSYVKPIFFEGNKEDIQNIKDGALSLGATVQTYEDSEQKTSIGAYVLSEEERQTLKNYAKETFGIEPVSGPYKIPAETMRHMENAKIGNVVYATSPAKFEDNKSGQSFFMKSACLAFQKITEDSFNVSLKCGHAGRTVASAGPVVKDNLCDLLENLRKDPLVVSKYELALEHHDKMFGCTKKTEDLTK